jgi:hypothetical protein
MSRFHFPQWVNRATVLILGFIGFLAAYAAGLAAYTASPSTLNVGYSPPQPVPFSHKLHAGDLKIDCRYCHSTVDKAAHAAVPATNTCTNCHGAAYSDGTAPMTAIHTQSVKLLPVRQSQTEGTPILWERVHDLGDYVYFDHSAHVNRGVGCVSCHGRVDKMEQVVQVKPLSMADCLECHRNPGPHLRPAEAITDLAWQPTEDPQSMAERLIAEMHINPSDNCSTCHR